MRRTLYRLSAQSLAAQTWLAAPAVEANYSNFWIRRLEFNGAPFDRTYTRSKTPSTEHRRAVKMKKEIPAFMSCVFK